jgi:hypothetical protein
MFGMNNERSDKDLVWLVVGLQADDSKQSLSTGGPEVELVAGLNVFDGEFQRSDVAELEQSGLLGMRSKKNCVDLRRDFEVPMVDELYAYHGCRRVRRRSSPAAT